MRRVPGRCRDHRRLRVRAAAVRRRRRQGGSREQPDGNDRGDDRTREHGATMA